MNEPQPHRVSDNIILSADSYKQTHHKMYPPDTRYVGSYLESREGGEYDTTVFFGLQYLLDRHLAGVRVTEDGIREAEELCKWHFGRDDVFNRPGWEHILDEHGGRLPVSIRAVPEGTVVPSGNVLLTIQNTDHAVPWLTNHIETVLLQLWYPCTVSTIGRILRGLVEYELRASGVRPNDIDYAASFALHDFGFRGSTSTESAALGGAAHLVNFEGTDNLAAVRLLAAHYGAKEPGYSVPAAEHSTITSWGEEREADAYSHILDAYPTGTVSVVSDSWDVIRACRDIWGGTLKDRVAGGAPGRRLVIRPDSGDPLHTLLECLGVLGEKFGYAENRFGYKVLPGYIRLLQGDGITRHSLPNILKGLQLGGWSAENVVFGSGGGLLQDCDRDTLRFALKCNWADVNGEIRDVFKRPATDVSKSSKAGKLKLVRSGGDYRTVRSGEPGDDVMREVFRDGRVLERCTLDGVRAAVRADVRSS